jgi:hypothetical protein
MTNSKSKPCWYHPTPGRVVFGLLVAEVFLLLSEWGQWFAFNDHKGWTVLIGATVLGAGILLMLAWFGVSMILRRGFRFGLRTLLLFVLVCAVVCSRFAVKMNEAKRQREAVGVIVKLGGNVWYDYQLDGLGGWVGPHDRSVPPPGPSLLRSMLGEDFFADVTVVNMYSTPLADAELEHLKWFTHLQWLYLSYSNVTDTGLANLAGLTQIQFLNLSHTNVTDGGLAHLKGLTNLQGLWLYNTQVTDEGVKELQKALPNCEIWH